MADDYTVRRERVLREIAPQGPYQKDLSPKGSLDAPIVDLINEINNSPGGCIYTTSSCSGRITLFTQKPGQRKGGRWEVCSHDKVTYEEIANAIHATSSGEKQRAEESSTQTGEGEAESKQEHEESSSTRRNDEEDGTLTTFRFEPFILCCECKDLATAYKLLGVANRTGMRESGIMGGIRRVLVGIRCSLRMEVAVRADGKALIPPSFTRFLTQQANQKFDENTRKTEAFRAEFKRTFYGRDKGKNDGGEVKDGDAKEMLEHQQPVHVFCLRKDTQKVKERLKQEGLLPKRLRVVPAVLPSHLWLSSSSSSSSQNCHDCNRTDNDKNKDENEEEDGEKDRKDRELERTATGSIGGGIINKQDQEHQQHSERTSPPACMLFSLPPSVARNYREKGGAEVIFAREKSACQIWVAEGVLQLPQQTKEGQGKINATSSKNKRSSASSIPSASASSSSSASSSYSTSPYVRMCQAVKALCQTAAASDNGAEHEGQGERGGRSCCVGASWSGDVEQAVKRLPRKWHKIGDIALLKEGAWLYESNYSAAVDGGENDNDESKAAASSSMLSSSSKATKDSLFALGDTLWSAIASSLSVRRVALQSEISTDITRKPQVKIVWSAPPVLLNGGSKEMKKKKNKKNEEEEGGWVSHKEGGITYRLDVTRSMFCAGNGTEKKRVGKICKNGDIVVDLYAGIGYFVLPYLVHGKAGHVHACELNPASVEALRQALEINGVRDRCTIYDGDNKNFPLRGVADRVNLGLIPSSEKGWPIAVGALKPQGGSLHVHGNCAEDEVAEFAESVRSQIEQIAHSDDDKRKHSWQISVAHVERVKWYAPRIRHVVVDLVCH